MKICKIICRFTFAFTGLSAYKHIETIVSALCPAIFEGDGLLTASRSTQANGRVFIAKNDSLTIPEHEISSSRNSRTEIKKPPKIRDQEEELCEGIPRRADRDAGRV
ncbi:unnamed protein product, partial [Nesidiocoris tenuis]